MADTKTEEKDKIPGQPPGYVRILVKWGLVISLVLSLASLVVYLSGADFTDEILFLLLWLLRCLSVFVCVFSLYSLLSSIRRMIHGSSAAFVLTIALYFVSFLWGAGLIVFSTFMVALAEGNV